MNISTNSGRFKKGQIAWNKGKEMPSSMKEKMCEIAKKRIGALSPRWQENPSYNAVHLWIRKLKGKAIQCELCKVRRNKKMIHWANRSGKYLRDESDWIQLCVKCHKRYDKPWLKLVRNGKGQFVKK
ncbi:MAG: hypothetical protein PHG61_05070 [Candidatus Marinimicrobia bacterium]|nr:hypothetical protein [Candidatus Neomarinimicrobiota bacterium]